MNPVEILLKKRDGIQLSREEVDFLIQGCTHGTIPDYQLSAFLMAYYFQDMRLGNMDYEELAWLTDAMARSGDRIDLSSEFPMIADKHSTGGVGDKLSFICAPIMAAAGIPTFLLSGRGLGHTGGTLDKMEAVPGMRVQLSVPEVAKGLRETGLVISGQTGDLAPADKKLYALRDVTGTVPSVGLISASILSKKLCVHPAVLVLDIKCGHGAFMKTLDDARRLATTMLGILKALDRPASALITDMDQPLGRMVGNALEIRESCEILQGKIKPGELADVVEISIALAAEIFVLTGKAARLPEAELLARDLLSSGKAWEKFRAFMVHQGADGSALDDPSRLPRARSIIPVKADRAGFITAIDSEALGLASNALGAGRMKTSDIVDPAVGIELMAKVGDRVEAGTEIALLHVNDSARSEEVLRRVQGAYTMGPEKPSPRPFILDRPT